MRAFTHGHRKEIFRCLSSPSIATLRPASASTPSSSPRRPETNSRSRCDGTWPSSTRYKAFRGHVVFEKRGGDPSFNIVTIAASESRDAIEDAKKEVSAYYRRIGFDMPETP